MFEFFFLVEMHSGVLNGCLTLNGGCTDLCEPDENGHPLCTCKPGRKLDIDLHTCSPILPPGENQTCPQGDVFCYLFFFF